MDVKKTVISLLLGIAGGFIAFFIADSLKDKQVTPEIRHEIVGPGIKSVAYRPEPENTGSFCPRTRVFSPSIAEIPVWINSAG